jgi:hypothetical protein
MPPLFLLAAIACTVAQVSLPRRLAFIPILAAAFHLGNIEIFANLTIFRLLIIIGLIRAASGGHFHFSFSNTIDRLIVFFAVIYILSSLGHNADPQNSLVARIGGCLNVVGTYIYGRSYFNSSNPGAFKSLLLGLPIILVPLALLMALERQTGRNIYFYLGSRTETSLVRENKVRAVGPFRHPILAGTAGASALPLAYYLWLRRRRALGAMGLASGLGIVWACSSSGPMAAVGISFAAILGWRFRSKIPSFLVMGIIGGFAYWIITGRGPWFLMAKMDLAGGSTGRFRSDLIDAAIKNLDEWWLFGTDYTRHWMMSGVSFSENHTDLTNYYIHLGAMGGIGLPILLVVILWRSLKSIYQTLMETGELSGRLLWLFGAVICTHAVSFVSVSYFDQMYVPFYMTLGMVPGLLEVARGSSTDVLAANESEFTATH